MIPVPHSGKSKVVWVVGLSCVVKVCRRTPCDDGICRSARISCTTLLLKLCDLRDVSPSSSRAPPAVPVR